MNVLHATASQGGLATGLFILGGLIARMTSVRIIEKAGYKKILYLGLCIYLGTSLLYFTASNLTVLYIVRLMHGFGFGMSATTTGTIAAKLIPKERQGEGIGYYGLSTTIASAVGPLAGVYISQHSSFDVVLVCSSVITAVCILVSVFIRLPASFSTNNNNQSNQTDTSEPSQPKPIKHKNTINDFIEKKALPISFVCFLIVFGYSSILAFLTKFAESTSNSGIIAASGIFFLIYSVFVLLSRPVTGRLFDKYGENVLIYPSIVFFAVGLLILGLSNNGFVMLCSAAFIGFGYGTFFSSANAIAIKVSPRDRIHLATATYFSFADLGAGIGPFILGLIITSVGFRNLYFVMAALVIFCVAIYYFVHGKGAKPEKVKEPAVTETTELVGMKLVYAIISHEDEHELISELSRRGFSATKQATSGGFLRKSNITLMIGTPAEQVKEVIDIIKSKCCTRKRVSISAEAFGIEGGFAPFPESVEVGSATIFVMNVEHFEKV